MLMAGVGIRALSFRARTVGVSGLLLLALYASEWKVGDEPGLQLSLSPKEKIKIEITLPDLWAADEQGAAAAQAVIISSQASNLALTVERTDMGQRPPDPSLERWYPTLPPAPPTVYSTPEIEPEPELGDSRTIEGKEEDKESDDPLNGRRKSK